MATNVSFGTYQAKPQGVEIIDINIGVFFDGTRNNRTNSRIAGKTEENDDYTYTISKEEIKEYEQQLNDNKLSSEESWNNDLSNIARLEKHYKKEDYIFSIYTEGIGTYDAKQDTMEGFAFGAGKYGIPEKVKKASDEIYNKIKDMFSTSEEVVKVRLYFDVYGFSRGAGAARHFVAMIKENVYEALKKIKKINIVKKEVRFLGIFDTVSSYDPTIGLDDFLKRRDSLDLKNVLLDIYFGKFSDSLIAKFKLVLFSERLAKLIKAFIEHVKNKGFENDIDELKLNNLQEAKEVLHFTASYEDEHRQFFALTRAVGANTSNIREYGFHGAHSDIGGSYIHNAREEVVLMNSLYKVIGDFLLKVDAPSVSDREIFKSDLEKLTKQGWFTGKNEAAVDDNLSSELLNFIILFNNMLSGIKLPNIHKKFYTLKSTRARLSNRYSYVFLYLMAEESNLKTDNVFAYDDLKNEFVLPIGKEDKYFDVDLRKVKQMYSDYIQGDINSQLVYDSTLEFYRWKYSDNIDLLSKKYRQSASVITKRIERNDLIKKLRNKYFHFSACASIGYIPKYSYSKVDYGNYKHEVNRNRLIIVK